MRRTGRTLRVSSVLPKTQRNRAILLRTRLTTLWRIEIHMNLKIEAQGQLYLYLLLISVISSFFPISSLRFKILHFCTLKSP